MLNQVQKIQGDMQSMLDNIRNRSVIWKGGGCNEEQVIEVEEGESWCQMYY